MARAIFPELMRSRGREGSSAHFHTLLARIVRLSGVGAGFVVLLLLVLGRPALALIGGHQFLWVYPVLLLLGASAAFDFASVGFEPALVALGRPGLALKLRFVSTMIFLAITVGLTAPLGIIGAGVAALVASIVSMMMLWFALTRLRDRDRLNEPYLEMTMEAALEQPDQ
jgi:O-antigen/teichoic acid export membrane protein